ncbi:TRAP transporter small permease subunit [Gymnodinialimonas ulvae]|uniref:TRAP transporter small permease subunit n=1 Tax=Gymnodinialimonas ulvae TaxID=3126504 RepID=UPI0030AAD5AB
MSSASSVLADDSLVSRLDRMLLPVEMLMIIVSGLFTFGLMFLAVFSVGGREFFGSPLRGYVDWIEMAMPFIAIFGISYVQRSGAHIRMDIVIGAFRGRLLWAVELLMTILIFLLIALLLWGAWSHFDRSFDFSRPNWSRDSSIDINLPIWPAKLAVVAAFAVLTLRAALQIWAYGRALWLGLDRPAAVPFTLSVEQQAAAEAQQVSGRD